jgi:hypothetical protein
MKNKSSRLQLIAVFIGCWFLAGCISTKYVERKQYLLDIPKSLAKKNSRSSSCSIFVEDVAVAVPFNQLDFLYRVESGRYLPDYYNGFLAAPAEQLDTILRAYLRVYSNCNLEITKLLTSPPNSLQVKLVELYADYREHNNPQAVFALQFYLTTTTVDGKSVVLLDKILRASVPLKAKDTESLISAWNEGVRDVLGQGMQMLNQALGKQK